ncbi:class I SAM-dependent methyltransferase [Streptomyces sp. NPDC013178]|uniref:class I SAM-dependent methyltransferase n=1 Tax=Streptomyces sp. NPDC013178 TaxID=3155118 RepID=UPI0033E8606B
MRAPGGKALARLLTEPVRSLAPRPPAVLEAGAGTGAVTRALIPQLPRGSLLDIVEPNPLLAVRLRNLVATHPYPAGSLAQLSVHQAYVDELDTDQRYDVIISGLPLTDFTPDQAEHVMAQYLRILHPGGILTYHVTCGTRRARALLTSRAAARRRAAVNEVMAAYQRDYAIGRWPVWANLPPAHVWQLQRPPASPRDQQEPLKAARR